MGDLWSGKLQQQMQETGNGQAARAGSPGMGMGPVPYAKGATQFGRSGPPPRSVSPMGPPNTQGFSSPPTSMGSSSAGQSAPTPNGGPGLPPEIAQQYISQLYAALQESLNRRSRGY